MSESLSGLAVTTAVCASADGINSTHMAQMTITVFIHFSLAEFALKGSATRTLCRNKNASVAVIGIAARLLSLGKLYCSFAERNGILANLPVRRRIALKCGRRFRLHGVLVRMANERLRSAERPSSVYCMHDGPWPLNRALEFSVAPRHNPRHTVVM